MAHRLHPLAFLAGTVLLAQAPAPAPTAAGAAPAATAAPDDVAIIKATPYKPTLQRDPFATPRDDRPTDAQDLLDDISVKGIMRRDGKNFAIISDSRGNVRWLPVGHRFKDGEIAAITDSAVVFHQWELNTTNRSVFRTVTKTFKREEGNR
jgi:Tfp pilus assembly protein PilP